MVELKTHHSDNFRVEKHLPQLWFGRTPKVLVGTYTDGTFHKLEFFHVSSQLLECEVTHQVELRKLTWLIAELSEATRGTQGGCCVLVGIGRARKANVYAAGSRTSVFPDYIVKQFWR